MALVDNSLSPIIIYSVTLVKDGQVYWGVRMTDGDKVDSYGATVSQRIGVLRGKQLDAALQALATAYEEILLYLGEEQRRIYFLTDYDRLFNQWMDGNLYALSKDYEDWKEVIQTFQYNDNYFILPIYTEGDWDNQQKLTHAVESFMTEESRYGNY